MPPDVLTPEKMVSGLFPGDWDSCRRGSACRIETLSGLQALNGYNR